MINKVKTATKQAKIKYFEGKYENEKIITFLFLLDSLLKKAVDNNDTDLIRKIQDKISSITSCCDAVCIDTSIFSNKDLSKLANTAPITDNNQIIIYIQDLMGTDLTVDQVIHNYRDAEHNKIKEIVFTLVSGEVFNHGQQIHETTYEPPFDFSLPSYGAVPAPGKFFVYRNEVNYSTPLEIDEINLQLYDDHNYHLKTPILADKIRMQLSRIDTENIPSDSIIYFSVTEEDFTPTEISTIKSAITFWWVTLDQDKSDLFPCSNVFNNDHFNPGAVTQDGYVEISDLDIEFKENGKRWLQVPINALRRKIYHEGTNQITLEDFKKRVKDSSVYSFAINRSAEEYHDDSIPTNNSLISNTEPSFRYLQDYKLWKDHFKDLLNSNKCFVSSNTDKTSALSNLTLLQLFLSFELSSLSNTEIDVYLTPDKTAYLGSYICTNYLYAPLSLSPLPYERLDSPYSFGFIPDYAGFKDTFEQEYAGFRDTIIDSLDGDIKVGKIYDEFIDMKRIEVNKSISLNYSVQDNHPLNPLYSDIKTTEILIRSRSEKVYPISSPVNITKTRQPFLLNWQNFDVEPEVDKIMIKRILKRLGNVSLTHSIGTLKYKEVVITEEMALEGVIITKEDIDNGYLKYYPSDVEEYYKFVIQFERSESGSLNYSGFKDLEVIINTTGEDSTTGYTSSNLNHTEPVQNTFNFTPNGSDYFINADNKSPSDLIIYEEKENTPVSGHFSKQGDLLKISRNMPSGSSKVIMATKITPSGYFKISELTINIL